jgi:hypothetical protein
MTLSDVTDRWNLLGVAATTLCTCIGGFLVLPPLDYGSSSNWTHFGVFLVTVLVGLWSIPVALARGRHALKLWSLGTVVFVVLGTLCFFSYDNKMTLWTFEYGGQREISGAYLTPDAQSYEASLVRAGRSATAHDLAWEFGGNFADVWVSDGSRDRRLRWLLQLYLAQLLLFASAIICIVQTSFCVTQPPAPNPAEPRGAQL